MQMMQALKSSGRRGLGIFLPAKDENSKRGNQNATNSTTEQLSNYLDFEEQNKETLIGFENNYLTNPQEAQEGGFVDL